MKDELGDRMKSQYEDRTRYLLPRRTYTIIRLDGKAFHTLTKGFARPFDQDLINIMDATAKTLCEEVQGVKIAYVQSDEISLVLTDFEGPKTNAWFDGNVQKMASVSSSIATAAFNRALRTALYLANNQSGDVSKYHTNKNAIKTATFDSRVFTIPDFTEAKNYLIWRQQDCTKNSISQVAQSLYSHKELHGQNGANKQDLIHAKGQNWNDYPAGQKRGRCIVRVQTEKKMTDPRDGKEVDVIRSEWRTVEPPIFTQDDGKEFLNNYIPRIS